MSDTLYNPIFNARGQPVDNGCSGQTGSSGQALGQFGAQLKTTPPPAVHSAMEALDKAIAGLLSEMDGLESRLQSVLAQLPAANKTGQEPTHNVHSVAGRINCAADVVAAVLRRIADMRNRLEV